MRKEIITRTTYKGRTTEKKEEIWYEKNYCVEFIEGTKKVKTWCPQLKEEKPFDYWCNCFRDNLEITILKNYAMPTRLKECKTATQKINLDIKE